MKLFSVTVSRVVLETLANTVEIEAPDAATAEKLALQQWEEGELELYPTGWTAEDNPAPVEAAAREAKEP